MDESEIFYKDFYLRTLDHFKNLANKIVSTYIA